MSETPKFGGAADDKTPSGIDRFKQYPRCSFQATLQWPRQDDRCGHGNEAFSVSTRYGLLVRLAN